MSHAAAPLAHVAPTGIPSAHVAVTIPPTESASRRSFGRLVHAEFRKLVDTRASLWLLMAMAVLTIVVTFGMTLLNGYLLHPGGPMEDRGQLHLAASAASGATVMTTLIAILSILTIAGEWGQRTTLSTFALEPSRTRVLAAKIVVVLAVATVMVGVAFLLSAAGQAVAHAVFHAPVSYQATPAQVFGFWLTMMLSGPLLGAAFALLLLNNTGAILAYLLLPIVFSLLRRIGSGWHSFGQAVTWINPNDAQLPFAGQWHLADFGPVAATALIWIVIPAAFGTWRWLHRESR